MKTEESTPTEKPVPWTTDVQKILATLADAESKTRTRSTKVNWRSPFLWTRENEHITAYEENKLLFLTLDDSAGVAICTPHPQNNEWEIEIWALPAKIKDKPTALLVLPLLLDTPSDHTETLHPSPVPSNRLTEILETKQILTKRETAEEETQNVFSAIRRAIHKTKLRRINNSLQQYFPTLIVEKADGIFPFQATGTWDGYKFYFRSKYGDVTLDIGRDDPIKEPYWEAEAILPGTDPNMFSLAWEEDQESEPLPTLPPIVETDIGEIDMNTFILAFLFLARHLKQAPYLHLFPASEDPENANPYGSRGQTAEEAYTQLCASDEGDSPIAIFSPLNTDERTFPETSPEFLDKEKIQEAFTALSKKEHP